MNGQWYGKWMGSWYGAPRVAPPTIPPPPQSSGAVGWGSSFGTSRRGSEKSRDDRDVMDILSMIGGLL